MEPDQSQKVTILLAALSERYQAMRTIRDRVQAIGLWAIGLLVGAGGWLIQSHTLLTCEGKLIASVGLASAFLPLRLLYLADLERGFKGQQQAAARVETLLGLYRPGLFDDGNEPVYPRAWKSAGSGAGPGRFFRSTYVLIYAGLAFLVLTIWVVA